MKIALIGCGNMGFALLERWASSGASFALHAIEPVEPLRDRAKKTGVLVFSSHSDLPRDIRFDVIVIALKPQHVLGAASIYGQLIGPEGVMVSIAAGVSIKSLEHVYPSMPIIRCMPNTPASIGEGMIVCCCNELTSKDQSATVEKLLSHIGKVEFVADETIMDAVTAVSGSGPAYLFYFIEAMASAAEVAGIGPELARILAKQTVYGAARLASLSDTEPSGLREQVTSPGGTTEAALQVLMGKNGLPQLLTDAVTAAKIRSIELQANTERL